MTQESYRISVVSRRTGLSIDKIRIWERRYGLIRPTRDGSGVRQYSARDIERLSLVRDAVELGHPVGRVASFSNARLRRIVKSSDGPRAGTQRAALAAAGSAASAIALIVAAVERFDPAEVERILDTLAISMAREAIVLDVLIPLMHEVGELWSHGRVSIAQEHLVSQIVRNSIGRLARFRPSDDARAMLFATPPNDAHEFGIVLAANLASARGIAAYVLGTNVPLDELVTAAAGIHPSAVVVALTLDPPAPDAVAYVDALAERLPRTVGLILAGSGAASLRGRGTSRRVRIVESMPDFLATLEAYDKTRQ
ncbi:MAG: MerR family transcriptional regulator [Candidatus Eremiobacteraeota bacterium]|nr:MerR family transcriptional regulator [Candidatus Eremiobacteraeota bacterium]